MPPDLQPPIARRRSHRPALLALLLAALAGLAFLLLRPSSPLLPIPVPAQIGTLDPQVRAHLAQIATRAGKDPRNAGLRSELGLAFAVNGLWTEARQCFLDALRLGDISPLPAMYAAIALQELGDYEGAIRELRQVSEKHPTFAPGWYRLGRAFAAAGRFPESSEAFLAVTRLAPNEWHGWAGLGECQLRAGKAGEALEPLTHARQLDPTARSVRHLLGQALQSTGRTNEARLELAAGGAQTVGPMPDPWSTSALEHMKALPDQFERADALMAEGDFPQAITRLSEALRFHPTNATVIASLARAFNGNNQAPAAWDLLAEARTRSPSDVSLLTIATLTATLLDRTNDALDLSRQVLELAPQAAESHVAHANAMLVAGRDAEAIAALRKALALSPRDATLWVQLGDVQRHNLHDTNAALHAYQQGHESDPLHTQPLLALFDLLLEQRRFPEAAQTLATLRTVTRDSRLLRDLEQRLPRPSPRR